jgi:hypothetical protein
MIPAFCDPMPELKNRQKEQIGQLPLYAEPKDYPKSNWPDNMNGIPDCLLAALSAKRIITFNI